MTHKAIWESSSTRLLLCSGMGRIHECVPSQFIPIFVLFTCGKVEVRSRLGVDGGMALQAFSVAAW